MKKMSLLFILTFIMGFAWNISAQESDESVNEDWEINADLNLNLTQSSYNKWAGGEQGAISWSSLALVNANKYVTPKMYWKNTLRMAYGQTHNQETNEETGDDYWEKPKESTDELDLESIMNLKLGMFVDPYFSFRLKSVFSDVDNNFLNPIDFTEALGVGKEIMKDEMGSLHTRAGFAFRQHKVKDFDTTNDGGLEWVSEYHRLMLEKKVNFTSTLRIFQAVFYSESDTSNDDWKTPEMDWQNTFSLNVTKYISMNLYFQMLYDKSVVDDLQIKQTLGLGLIYKLF